MNKINLDQLLSKEMSRKEFLQHIGVFAAGAVGITAVVSQFSRLSSYEPGKPIASAQSKGYGARSYGR